MKAQPSARDAPIAAQVLDEAADWLMRLHGGNGSGAERAADLAAFARWRERSHEHARAWARAERLLHKFEGLPPALATPALARSAPTRRRTAVLRLAALLTVLPAGAAAWRLSAQRGWFADYHTATGQRLQTRLPDGTQLSLSTASAIDVRYDDRRRSLVLRRGVILVDTAADARQRPFHVHTAEGSLQALGTRFSVRQQAGRTHVAVLQGAVRITPADAYAPQQVVAAGQQAYFSATAVQPAGPADDGVIAWQQGMLVADRMRLADFCAELAQWHPGFLRCEPQVAELRISGAFPVAQPERALTMLVSTYPVQAATRLRGHWVTLIAR